MEPASFVQFTAAARRVADQARRLGLAIPGFRSPPRVAGADRTLRLWAGGAVVAVRIRDRPLAAVLTDLVEGVVAANRLEGRAAARAREALLAAVSEPPAAGARASPSAPAAPAA